MKNNHYYAGETFYSEHDGENVCEVLSPNVTNRVVATVYETTGIGFKTKKEKEIAEIFAEALNVKDSCGLTPSELLEQNEDRLNKIRSLTHLLKASFEGKPDVSTKDVIGEAIEYINTYNK